MDEAVEAVEPEAAAQPQAEPVQAEPEAPKEETPKLWSEDKPEPEAKKESFEEMPWLMRDKFKGETEAEIVAAQAKAYSDLSKKMGKFWGAPKDGEYSLEGLEEIGITKEDPVLKHLTPELKDLGLSNDGLHQLAKSYSKAVNSMAEEMSANLAKELTASDANTVQVVDGWLKDNFTQQERDKVKSWIQSVDDFKILNSIRARMPSSSNVPSHSSDYGSKFESSRDVESEKIDNFKRFNSDQNYRNHINQRLKDAFQREKRAR